MNKTTAYLTCRTKADDLLNKYFGDFCKEAAIEHPETIKEKYDKGLPARIEAEFLTWLSGQWEKCGRNEVKPFSKVMNLQFSRDMVDMSYLADLERARLDAQTVTLWERITRSNHDDVTYYVGLLKQYTEERLDIMVKDFVEDFYDEQ